MRRSKMILATVLVAMGFLFQTLHAQEPERVVRITAKQFAFDPSEVVLRKGEPVVLEFVSLDKNHGFRVPALGIRIDIRPGDTSRIRLVPQQTGRFPFECDVFCGEGHEDMTGELVVVE